ncbi:MAG: cupredoxin domain-containing protein [Candidatus Levybacteria bacterium]|nr:cupredoxin domain-containing protein [Candidatus Levybacteria bacterium]
MRGRNFLIGIIFLLLAGGVIFAVSNTANQQSNPETSITQPTQKPVGGSGPTDLNNQNVKTFEVTGSPFQFNPNEIRVKKGDLVQIVFNNQEGFHDLTIDEFNAKTKQIQAGQTDTVMFIADKTGVFEYYCSVDGHREQGMVGSLIVEE